MSIKSFKPWIYLYIAGLLLSQLACSAVGGTPASPPAATGEPVPLETKEPRPANDAATEQPQAPATPGLACVGTFGYGVTCIDRGEWVTFTKENSALGGDLVKDIAACPNHRFLFLHTNGISAFDGTTWKEYASGWGYGSASAIACDAKGGIWVAHYQGASYYDTKTWKTYGAQEVLSTGPDATGLVEDVAIAPDGKVWVVTASSIAVFSKGEWTVYQEGAGFDKRYFFSKVTFDRQGLPWVATSSGLLAFDGTNWTAYPNNDLSSTESLAIDQNGRAWAGTLSKGVFVFEDGGWFSYNRRNSDLGSDDVRAIVIDAGGRVWLGTEWGLSVVDGDTWTTYRMDNADLTDHDIYALTVMEGGPTLPAPRKKDPGSLTARLVYQNGEPLKGAAVEICVEKLYSRFYGATPCSDQPYIRDAETDSDGNLTVTDLPPGRYVLTVNTGKGWAQLTGPTGLASERMAVYSGEKTDVGEIIINSE